MYIKEATERRFGSSQESTPVRPCGVRQEEKPSAGSYLG